MKKVVSVILAVLLASLGTAAFAAGTRETYEGMGTLLRLRLCETALANKKASEE
ncbi:MAG: hypothetical protein J6A79_00285 [Clostridia bacterium]|nr:hypothetical protein [Clostridia bacterium]